MAWLNDLLQYDFIGRALAAGLLVAVIAPLIGIFLVLRGYSLIADTLAHVSLAGIALGLLIGVNPIFTALLSTAFASLGMDRLRSSQKIHGESALALFLSGSLAVAILMLSMAKSLNASLLNYLFGNILTVTSSEIQIIAVLAAVVLAAITLFYKELLYTTFDEDSAQVSGIHTRAMQILIMLLTAITVSLSIRIVGVLLISALIVVPVLSALQLKKTFFQTILWAELVSVLSVVLGLLVSFHWDLAASATIVLICFGFFMGIKLSKA